MSSFRRIEAARAGPTALGILVPPGRRTILIVRPRTLEWDLLPVTPPRENTTARAFLELGRDETARLGRDLYHALEALPGGGPGQIEVLRLAGGSCLVQVQVGPMTLLVCRRVPGQAYQPMMFATLDDATRAAERLTGILCPAAGVCQEIYFNTQAFSE